MYNPRQAVMKRVISIAVLALIALVCLVLYRTQTNPYAPSAATASYKPPVTNAAVLKNWMPASVYSTTLQRINEYLHANNLSATALTVQGTISFDPVTYDFDMQVIPKNSLLAVNVTVNNYASIITTSVTINGRAQGIEGTATSPSQTGGNPAQSQPGQTTQFINMDALLNAGVTTIQSDEMQAAIETFSPNAGTVTIDPATVTALPQDPTQPQTTTFAFALTIDTVSYNADLTCTGISTAQVQLFHKTGGKAYDSGTLSQNP